MTVELHTATSRMDSPEEAARELSAGLRDDARVAFAFVPPERDHAALARALRDQLPKDTRLAYATSGAPIGREGSIPGVPLLVSLVGDVEVGLGLGQDLSGDAMACGMTAVRAAAQQLGVRPNDLDPKTTLGIVIDDGLQLKKDELLLGILDTKPDLSLVGGGASNGKMGEKDPPAVVGVDGEVSSDAALVALLRSSSPWATFRHHAYQPTGQTLTVTKVDDTSRIALEIDGEPAAQRYATLLGVGIDELEFGKPRGFSDRPTALRVGREYFMKSPWMPLPDGSVLFVDLVLEGMELEIMKIQPLVESLQGFLRDDVSARVGETTGVLCFNCYGRYMMQQATGINDAIDEVLAGGPPVAGINAAGELFNGFPINSSLTAVAFGHGA